MGWAKGCGLYNAWITLYSAWIRDVNYARWAGLKVAVAVRVSWSRWGKGGLVVQVSWVRAERAGGWT